jgi:methyltransferase
MALYLILAFVVVQRLAELSLSARNTRLLKAQGGIETGARHYPLFILLHTSWLLAILLTTRAHAPVHWPALMAFVALQLGRLWVIASLGGSGRPASLAFPASH